MSPALWAREEAARPAVFLMGPIHRFGFSLSATLAVLPWLVPRLAIAADPTAPAQDPVATAAQAMRIDQLKPTQYAVGVAEVEEDIDGWRKEAPSGHFTPE